MEAVKRSIGTSGVFSYRESLSIWHVFIPSDEDRDKYIANCKRTGTVTVINDNSEVVSKVRVGKIILQELQFPQNQDELGSPLLCASLRSKNELVVIDIFDFEDDYNELREDESALIEKSDTGIAEVRVQGKDGVIYLHVDTEEVGGGKVVINVSNADSTGELQVNVDGSVNVNAGGEITSTSNTKISGIIKDEVDDQRITEMSLDINTITTKMSEIDDEGEEKVYYNKTVENGTTTEERYNSEGELIWSKVNDGVTSIEKFFVDGSEKLTLTKDGESLSLGTGDEAMVLGETLAQLLKDFISEVSISTTNAGPLLNASTIAEFIGQVDTILSQYSKTQ